MASYILQLPTHYTSIMACCLCGFGTNSSVPKCKNGRCRICLKVAIVNEEIKRAVTDLQRLLTKRTKLRSEQNHAHDIMHRLPLELKNRIFELVLPTRDEWGSLQVGWPRGKSPSYLTSICRNWRDIALSNPFLWSTIPIVLGAPSTSDPGWVNFVYDWIQRSRNSPPTLHISTFDNDGSKEDILDDMEEQLNNVLGVMVQCPNEWQSLSLDIPISFMYIFRDGDNYLRVKSHLPTVRRLRIDLCTDDWDDDIDQPVPPTMSPEIIDINGLSFNSLPISWNHLTSATVTCWNLEDVTQLFQLASQMIYCSIIWPDSYDSEFEIPPIIHRMLQTLSLHYSDYSGVPTLLNSLILPCLRAVETNVVDIALLSLVRRSSCPLTRITIYGITKLPSDLHPIPGVTNLVLGSVYDNAVLKVLLLEGYFPDLCHLTLPLQSFVTLWGTGVISMLLDRNRSGVVLRNIFVVDPLRVGIRDSEFGKQLGVFQLSISLREGGFEFLIPEVARGDEGR